MGKAEFSTLTVEPISKANSEMVVQSALMDCSSIQMELYTVAR